MKILNCFRPEPDLESLPESVWELPSGQVDLAYQKPVWNCFDESALALTLALMEQSGEAVEAHALSAGDGRCIPFLQTLSALGFAKTIYVDCSGLEPFRPEAVATVLGAAARWGDYDLLVVGQQSAEGGSGTVPMLMAEYLGWSCIQNVADYTISDDSLTVVSHEAWGRVTWRAALPCVLSVGNAVRSVLRVPTLRDKMTLGRKPITRLTLEDLELRDLPEPEFSMRALYPVRTGRVHAVIPGQTSAELAAAIYETDLKGWRYRR